MNISAKTDIGRKRSINQDAVHYQFVDDNLIWGIVCDGMGGMAAGNIASEEAIKAIANGFSQNLSAKTTPKQIVSLMKASIESANAMVYDLACRNEEYRGMGTTVVAVIIKDGMAYISNVGDSRAYLLSKGVLSQITTDHSVVQSMVERGQLTVDEAAHHPSKNIITRAVGVASQIDIDFYEVPIASEDVLLLCTDGLTNCVENDELKQAIEEDEFSSLADRLINAANAAGGSDNITVFSVKL